jgi:hypothetical protein
MQPDSYPMQADPELIAIDQEAPVFEEQQPEEEVGLNPVQEQAANSWKQAGLDPEAAMNWADSPESPLSEDTYNRVGELLNDENPEVVQLSMGLLGLAHRSTEFFNLESEQVAESFSEEQQHGLVDVVGGEYASEIVNTNYRLMTGEISKADAIREVAMNPSLSRAYFKAMKAGLLVINL